MKKPPTYRRFALGSPWREQIVLDDGRMLLLRPVDAADAEPMRAGFPLLSAEERRARYLHPVKELDEAYLQALTHPRPGHEFVLVLAEPLPPGEALIGGTARLVQRPGTRQADFAILVSHFVSGHGLGRLLMKKLIAHARRRRLDEIIGDVLDDNEPMLKLAEELGFQREPGSERGLVRIRLSLRAAPKTPLSPAVGGPVRSQVG